MPIANYHSPYPLALIILDGLGNNPRSEANAFKLARTPTLTRLRGTVPYTELVTCGERVGLPKGQMGNSEVGHLNIGAGRVVDQDLLKINKTIDNNGLGELTALIKTFDAVKVQDSRALHLVGLLSQGGVHSSNHHVEALIREALKSGVKQIYIHAFSDGRDRPPQAALAEIGELNATLTKLRQEFKEIKALRIATLIGRYFAMDRDQRWERTQKAYDLLTQGLGTKQPGIIAALESRAMTGTPDEFLEPMLMTDGNTDRPGTIQDGDAVLFFNFRSDRMRQLVAAFFNRSQSFTGFSRKMHPELSALTTLTAYAEGYPVNVVFEPTPIKNHLGSVIAQAGLNQLRIAETEKYPHVTYFFNGGSEAVEVGEDRILVPSPRDVATYDLKPEMSAHLVSEKLINALRSKSIDFTVLNFANCDMVGHTGKLEAAIKAVETVDSCLGNVLATINDLGGCALVTADHGNAEQMNDYITGEPHTTHTTFNVPFFLVGKAYRDLKLREDGALCDIAPTVCQLLDLRQPTEMTGRSLLE